MKLQVPEGHHSADGKRILILFNGIQPQIAQVDGGTHAALAQPQPQHSAEDTVLPLLIQGPRLFQTLGPDIFLYGNHCKCSFSVGLHTFLNE